MNDNIKELYVQGLQAVHDAYDKGAQTADEISAAATDQRLKTQLSQGSQSAQQQKQTLLQVFAASGAQPEKIENATIDGMIATAKNIRERNQDPLARDLGIIASAQISFHYYIASLGTLRTYAQAIGENDSADMLQQLLDGIKQQDQQYTALSEQLIGG